MREDSLPINHSSFEVLSGTTRHGTEQSADGGAERANRANRTRLSNAGRAPRHLGGFMTHRWTLALRPELSFGLAAAAQTIRRAHLLIFRVVRSTCALCAVRPFGRASAGALAAITAFGRCDWLGRGFGSGSGFRAIFATLGSLGARLRLELRLRLGIATLRPRFLGASVRAGH